MRSIAKLAVLAALAGGPLAAGCGGSDGGGDPTTISVSVPSTTSSATTTTSTEPASGGGGSGGEASGDASKPKPVPGSGSGATTAILAASAVLTDAGTDEQACGSFVTEQFIESSYGGEQNCIASRRGEALARAIAVGPGDDEQSTHLVVVPKGGPYDGARVEVELVADEGGFRVDSLKAHVPAGP